MIAQHHDFASSCDEATLTERITAEAQKATAEIMLAGKVVKLCHDS